MTTFHCPRCGSPVSYTQLGMELYKPTGKELCVPCEDPKLAAAMAAGPDEDADDYYAAERQALRGVYSHSY